MRVRVLVEVIVPAGAARGRCKREIITPEIMEASRFVNGPAWEQDAPLVKPSGAPPVIRAGESLPQFTRTKELLGPIEPMKRPEGCDVPEPADTQDEPFVLDLQEARVRRVIVQGVSLPRVEITGKFYIASHKANGIAAMIEVPPPKG